MLGISGASFLFGALADWHYYLVGSLFLLAGLYNVFRRPPAAVSLAGRRRNRWLLPLIMASTAGAAYLAITFVVTPLLLSFTDSRPVSRAPISAAILEKTPAWHQAELHIQGMT